MTGKAGTPKKPKPIRVGVIGVGRGSSFASRATDLVGMKLVALCDTWEEKLSEAGKRYGVATYTDYDEFLEHDMDAVVLANYFHEQAPFAIKALAAGKHVMSETSCNATLAEGVARCRAVFAAAAEHERPTLVVPYCHVRPTIDAAWTLGAEDIA